MPFITVTYPPKYPLTDSEKEWLERRKEYLEEYMCSICKWEWNFDAEICFPKWEYCVKNQHLPPRVCEGNYEDSALFEALVSEGLALYRDNTATPFQNLKRIRLLVESVLEDKENGTVCIAGDVRGVTLVHG